MSHPITYNKRDQKGIIMVQSSKSLLHALIGECFTLHLPNLPFDWNILGACLGISLVKDLILCEEFCHVLYSLLMLINRLFSTFRFQKSSAPKYCAFKYFTVRICYDCERRLDPEPRRGGDVRAEADERLHDLYRLCPAQHCPQEKRGR